jgi:hypothetical protein
MRMLLIGAATAVTVAVLGVTPGSAGSIDRREHRQLHRIGQGIHSGALTRREAGRLLAEHSRIRAEEFVYRRTGGGLSPWERRDLHRDLNRASRHIWIQKHDAQRR